MGPDVIDAWLTDLHILAHSCPNPSTCHLPASAPRPSSCSPLCSRPPPSPAEKPALSRSPSTDDPGTRLSNPRKDPHPADAALDHKMTRPSGFIAEDAITELASGEQLPRRSPRKKNQEQQQLQSPAPRKPGQDAVRGRPRSRGQGTRSAKQPARTAGEEASSRPQPTEPLPIAPTASQGREGQQQTPVDLDHITNALSAGLDLTRRASEAEEDEAELLETEEVASIPGPNPQQNPFEMRSPFSPPNETGLPLPNLTPGNFSARLSRPSQSQDDRSTLPTPLSGSKSWSQPSASTRSRSTSPVKNAAHLQRLQKPVLWAAHSIGSLRAVMTERGSPAALSLLDNIRRVAVSNRAYLPLELRFLLDPELGTGPDDDPCFATRGPAATSHVTMFQSRVHDSLGVSLGTPPSAHAFHNAAHMISLVAELESLRQIVSATNRFKTVARAEASWNEDVHKRLLDLAVRDQSLVGVENITRASVAKELIPRTKDARQLQVGGRMVDYALVLHLDRYEEVATGAGSGSGETLATRIQLFVDSLTPPTFNQSTYDPLCASPSGVFVETKVNGQKHSEAQAQLGFWLAAWFNRVATFPRPHTPHSSSPLADTAKPPSCLPVVLVVQDAWELWFAFDCGRRFELCGPLPIGGTVDLGSAYRLLASLRLLAGWMAGEFLDWVKDCLDAAEDGA